MERVIDGPNNIEMYNAASLKIFHLLKQPTKYMPLPEHKPSLPELVQDIVKKVKEKKQKLGKFMLRLAQRSYGLLNGFVLWEIVTMQGYENLGDALLKTGIVNIVDDKIAKETTKKFLQENTPKYKEHWHGQILKYKPDVVVCGGTFGAVCDTLGAEYYETSTGMKWFKDPELENCVYLRVWHPSAWRKPVCRIHDLLMIGAKEILSK